MPAKTPEPPHSPPPVRSLLAMQIAAEKKGRAVHGSPLAIRTLGQERRLGADLYHRLMVLSGPCLLALFVGIFLAFNLAFACAYLADPQGIAVAREELAVPMFWRDFFFSVHTVATIGYGNMYPADVYTNAVVVVEITLGILYFALTTGIAFARFSRPTARLLFSRVMVVREIEGVPTLMLRAANQRHNMLYSAEARVSVLVDGDVGGIRMRRFVDLPLVKSSNPSFALTWTIMHAIDGQSPLASWLADGAVDSGAEIIVVLSGTDEVSGQLVHGRWAYGAEDILWGQRFTDIVGVDSEGVRTIDYTRFHDIEN